MNDRSDVNLRLLVATRSAHKIEEIRRIPGPTAGIEVLGLQAVAIPWSEEEEGLEPYDTFRENAASKARYFHRLSGLPTVADDSGLVVDALGGRPGVRSKRFAPDEGLEGEERDRANNRYLIQLLEDVPLEKRTARYVCVAALVTGDRMSGVLESPEDGDSPGGGVDLAEPLEDILFFRGEAPGLIVDQARGEGGFGYDPHFFDPELRKTFAQISAEEKNARSHRGRAFRALANFLAVRKEPPEPGDERGKEPGQRDDRTEPGQRAERAEEPGLRDEKRHEKVEEVNGVEE